MNINHRQCCPAIKMTLINSKMTQKYVVLKNESLKFSTNI